MHNNFLTKWFSGDRNSVIDGILEYRDMRNSAYPGKHRIANIYYTNIQPYLISNVRYGSFADTYNIY